MAFGELLQHVGDWGRFQILNTVLCVVVNLLSFPNELIENFSAAIPAHRCYVQLIDNATWEAAIPMNLSMEDLLRVSIPMDLSQKPEQCRRFCQTHWELLDANVSVTHVTELETESCLDGWVYDRSIFTSSIITEWDLVCGYESLKPVSQSISMAGFLVGTLLCGVLSDRFGRKPLLLFCCLTSGVLGLGCAFSPTFPTYCILRFLLSASLTTVQINTFILLLEGTSSKWQPKILMIFGLSVSLGQALLGGLAYIFRDWRELQLVVTVPYVILFFFFCCISESVRWLITTGKTEQALTELRRIAFINGKKDVAQSLTTEILISTMKEELNIIKNPIRIKEVITNPVIYKTVFCISFLLFSVCFGTYGLLLDLQNFGMNMFLTQFLLGIVDLPSKCLTLFVLRHINRRPSLAFLLLLSGIFVIASIFVTKEMPILHLIILLLGKSSFSMFNIIILAYLNELSPTPLRTTLNGIYGSALRLAATLSALLLITRRYFVHLPMILYGTVPITALICIYILPETINLPLPDAIVDLEKRFKKKSTDKRKVGSCQLTKETRNLLRAKEANYAHRVEELGIITHNAK